MKKRSNYFCGMKNFKFSAFTLAEMMVVMLILSIIMAAMAPVMTTRESALRDNSSPWKWSDDRADAWFGSGPSQSAMIGQRAKSTTDGNSRLIINAENSNNSHISFKYDGTIVGRLFLNDKNSMFFNNNGNKNTGSNNLAIGNNSLNANTTGEANTALGVRALMSSTGSYNTAVGTGAASNVTLGVNNTAIGVDNYNSATTASGNTSVGTMALNKLVTGDSNVAIGYKANETNTTITDTVAIGTSSIASQNNAVALGRGAEATGVSSIAIGSSTVTTKSSGNGSIAIGNKAKANNTNAIYIGTRQDTTSNNSKYNTGMHSIGIGVDALANQDHAIALGYKSRSSEYGVSLGYYANSSQYSVSLGYNAGIVSDGTIEHNLPVGNIAIGANTLALAKDNASTGGAVDAYGFYNIAIGHNAGADKPDYMPDSHSDCVGLKNSIAIGPEARIAGIDALALGSKAQAFNGAVAIGSNAFAYSYKVYPNTTYTGPAVAIGADSSAAGMNSVAIGNNAKSASGGAISIGGGNTRAGTQAVAIGEDANASGISSISIGVGANAAGTNNIAIGSGACQNVKGSNKVCIGTNSGPPSYNSYADASDTVERIFIGGKPKMQNRENLNDGVALIELYNDPSIGAYAVINANLVVRGHIALMSTIMGANDFRMSTLGTDGRGEHSWFRDAGFISAKYNDYLYHWWSDRRLKYVGSENKSGLEKIRQLKVFNYTFKKDPEKTPHVGVIAQDLQKIFPDAVKKGVDGFLTIRMEDMFYAVINAIKELDAKYQAQEKRINELEKRIEKLEAKVK